MEAHVYLAGPDVFRPNAIEIGKYKKNLLAQHNIIGHFPLDNELNSEEFLNPKNASRIIAQANENFMLQCCKKNRFGAIIANMNPYHGHSMDVGTAFEMGFMSAIAEMQKNILILGYSEDKRKFSERVIDDFYGGEKNIYKDENGQLRGLHDHNAIETFNREDNLMLTHAVEKTGGEILNSFEECVEFLVSSINSIVQ